MTAKITVKPNGSLKVEGDFEIYDHNDNKFDLNGRTQVAFCRCGQTSNQPFCDGAHKKCGFQSVVEACTLPLPKVAAPINTEEKKTS